MKRTTWVAGLVGGLVLGLGAVASAPEPATAAAFEKGNCNLCHAGVPGVQQASRVESCTDCHRWIRSTSRDPTKRAKALEIFPLWERYERNVATYMQVPSLDAAMARLDPDWVEGWLADPHDVRPLLPEGMPPFALDASERSAIARSFATRQGEVPKTSRPTKKNLERGREAYTQGGCPACHSFGAAVPGTPGIPAAPDLAHTAKRMEPDRVVAWIRDPKAISPQATMPSFGVSEDDAVAIRDFLFLADPEWNSPASVGADPVAVTRPVRWAEVEEKVFGKICAHCHMDPALPANQGRRGPGNAGGFGYPETGIHLQSREGIAAVADRIGPALLRRRHEALRDTVEPGQEPKSLTRPEKPGMPLGLPPLPDEDISLVLGWIEQGMPE